MLRQAYSLKAWSPDLAGLGEGAMTLQGTHFMQQGGDSHAAPARLAADHDP